MCVCVCVCVSRTHAPVLPASDANLPRADPHRRAHHLCQGMRRSRMCAGRTGMIRVLVQTWSTRTSNTRALVDAVPVLGITRAGFPDSSASIQDTGPGTAPHRHKIFGCRACHHCARGCGDRHCAETARDADEHGRQVQCVRAASSPGLFPRSSMSTLTLPLSLSPALSTLTCAHTHTPSCKPSARCT